jgi:cobalt/nickel transport system permease protein
MHVSDALVSPVVAGVAILVVAPLLSVAGNKLSKNKREDIIPLMGVLGAFVFTIQLINIAIPGTGSSGHVIGGVLLAAFLGPWAAFIVLSTVLIIQSLFFGDGGLLALGCNILNMAAMTCLVAYPLIFKPMVKQGASVERIFVASVATSIVGLELGAVLVSFETYLSGVVSLPLSTFLMYMLPIHLVIGVIDGLATGAILCTARRYNPTLLDGSSEAGAKSVIGAVLVFLAVSLVLGLGFMWLSSNAPDGLEWSLNNTIQSVKAGDEVKSGYDNALSGVFGGAVVMLLLWIIATVLMKRRRRENR